MENIQNFSSICIKCGMCCDGTLFRKAHIKDETDEQLVNGLGLSTFEEPNGKRYFRQPCPAFDTCCTVYQHRPKVCQHFLCEPLKKVKKGDIRFEEAQTIINTALELRAEVLTLNQKDASLAVYNLPELFEMCMPKPSDELKKNPVVLIKLIALRIALDRIRNKKSDSI